MLLKDKICVITGAASARGIGMGTARFFAEHGAKIVILDLDQAASKQAAASLPGSGHKGYACNVTDADACKEAAASTLKELGQVDILINNAGIAQTNKTMEIKREDYDLVMDVILRGTLNMCQAMIPSMRERKSGSIVNLGSVAAQRGGGIFGGPHYTAAKGGVIALTKALARELAPDQIRVNVVCPSFVATDIHGEGVTEERRLQLIGSVPLARLGTTRDVAGACLFLASDLAGYVTGIELDVNGGSHIH